MSAAAGAGAVVGRVVATEELPAGPHQFHFSTPAETPIGIGAIVRVDGPADRTVYAVVTDGKAYAEGHAEVRRWTAAVLRQSPEEPLQPVPLAEVRAAESADVAHALRMDSYVHGETPTAIPVGLYQAGGTRAPVYLDSDFLLGPESAHLNITGVSGLATKTSAITFLLQSTFAHFSAERGRVAAVCFNVKGPDLLYLDQAADIPDADREMYEALAVPAAPFRNVRYYAPYKADGANLNTLRTHADLVGSVEPLVWGLREVLDFHEVLMNQDDLDAKADAFVDFLADRVVDKAFTDDWGGHHRVESFTDLERLFRAIFDGLESTGRIDMWRTHHIATIRKVRNRLLNISTRCRGLVADDGLASDLPFGAFADRGVYVVDVAGVDPLGQDLVFTRIVSKLREHLERRDLGVEHVVVFVDELNKYAPGDGPETYVRRMLLDLAERGRYLGLVLFGAQQFRSQVHRRVVGNAGTALYGRMDGDELATPGYQVFSPATKIKLATMPKGELMVRHPHFAQPIFVRFPRPAVLAGRQGVERFPPAPEVEFADAVARQLVALDRRVNPGRVRDLVAGRREDDVRRALLATRRARPDDPLAFFSALLGRTVVRDVARPARGVAPLRSVEDPYAS